MQGERVALVFGSQGSGVVASFWKSDLPKTFEIEALLRLRVLERNFYFKPKYMIL